jgi:hypothetical protein
MVDERTDREGRFVLRVGTSLSTRSSMLACSPLRVRVMVGGAGTLADDGVAGSGLGRPASLSDLLDEERCLEAVMVRSTCCCPSKKWHHQMPSVCHKKVLRLPFPPPPAAQSL